MMFVLIEKREFNYCIIKFFVKIKRGLYLKGIDCYGKKEIKVLKWSSLIMGVLLLMLAVVIFTFPIENFYAITWLIGGCLY